MRDLAIWGIIMELTVAIFKFVSMTQDISKKVTNSEGSKMTIVGRFSANISAHGYKLENRYGSHDSIYLRSIMLPHIAKFIDRSDFGPSSVLIL